MENKQKELTGKELNLNELEMINGGIVNPIKPDDDDDDHEDSNNNGGGATGGW